MEPVKSGQLKRWEIALLLAVAGWLLLSSWAEFRQTELASRVMRLHVVANSDTVSDQRLKLQVRDAILKEAGECLEGCTSVSEAKHRITSHLQSLADAGERVVTDMGCRDPVRVSLERTYFPTKHFSDYALPAGEYQALRVVIGKGNGHNWWCVLFPPLSSDAVTERSETAVSEGLSEGDVALLTGADEPYVLRFKCLEWFGALRERFR